MLPFTRPNFDHHGGGDHVENHLLSRARFHPRRARDEFGPLQSFRWEVGLCRQRRIGIARDARGEDARARASCRAPMT